MCCAACALIRSEKASVWQAFQGVWRIQEGRGGSGTARLSYALFVRPQVWLPVRLIQVRS